MPEEDQPVINLLESHVIDQIAAGEVVERPASIVKELIENSVDAGASSIQVDIEGGGLGRITVTDDGVGMGSEDLGRCWQRHATSKLLNPADLFCIDTYGFRGEALSSIASVSELTITTRRSRDPVGLEVKVKGGKLISESKVSCPQGTSIDIQHLFFNTPARRKFLRSPATEQAHVVDACLRTTMGSRRVGMVLTAGKRRLVDVPSDARGRDRVETALGKRVGALCDFEYSGDGVRVSGFRSGLEVDRGDTKGIWIFVNGRYVRDKMLQRAVIEAFRTMVQRGRYPIVVLFVDIDPEAVDVNVHPQKLEVRFSEPAPIYRALSSALAASEEQVPLPTRAAHEARARVENATVRAIEQNATTSAEPPRAFRQQTPPGQQYKTNRPDTHTPSVQTQAKSLPVSRPEEKAGAAEWMSPWPGTVAGAVGEQFILYCPWVARQELAFETVSSLAELSARNLMLPVTLSLGSKRSEGLESALTSCETFGLRLRMVGPGRFLIQALPAVLGDVDPIQVVEQFCDAMLSGQPSDQASVRGELAKVWVALMDKNTAILQLDELERLMAIEERKSNGYKGFYRYRVVTVLERTEVEQRTQPAR